MTRRDWINAGGFLSVSSIVAGIAVAFIVPGMQSAVIVGTIPGIVYCIATWRVHE